jgi:hypothetical protein
MNKSIVVDQKMEPSPESRHSRSLFFQIRGLRQLRRSAEKERKDGRPHGRCPRQFPVFY